MTSSGLDMRSKPFDTRVWHEISESQVIGFDIGDISLTIHIIFSNTFEHNVVGLLEQHIGFYKILSI